MTILFVLLIIADTLMGLQTLIHLVYPGVTPPQKLAQFIFDLFFVVVLVVATVFVGSH